MIKISPIIAGKLLGHPAQLIRINLQRERLPIGSALLREKIYSYDIRPERLAQYMGIDIEELERRVNEIALK